MIYREHISQQRVIMNLILRVELKKLLNMVETILIKVIILLHIQITLDVRTFYSTHNVITERFTTEYLNEIGDKEETLYSWGGKLLRRTISTTIPGKHETKYEYYNDAGYPLYSDVKVKFPDGRVELIVTNDYDGYPVYYDYFIYDDNKRLDSQRKVELLRFLSYCC